MNRTFYFIGVTTTHSFIMKVFPHWMAALDHARSIIEQYDSPIAFELVQHDTAQQNDKLLADLPPYSLVINAMAMGKERPGSPLTDAARFSQNGIAWEFNYRGERQFLQQAHCQQTERSLTVVDGWDYFLVGWICVFEHVLHLSINEEMFQIFSDIAAVHR